MPQGQRSAIVFPSLYSAGTESNCVTEVNGVGHPNMGSKLHAVGFLALIPFTITGSPAGSVQAREKKKKKILILRSSCLIGVFCPS